MTINELKKFFTDSRIRELGKILMDVGEEQVVEAVGAHFGLSPVDAEFIVAGLKIGKILLDREKTPTTIKTAKDVENLFYHKLWFNKAPGIYIVTIDKKNVFRNVKKIVDEKTLNNIDNKKIIKNMATTLNIFTAEKADKFHIVYNGDKARTYKKRFAAEKEKIVEFAKCLDVAFVHDWIINDPRKKTIKKDCVEFSR